MCSEFPDSEIIAPSTISNSLQLNSTCTAYQFPNISQQAEFRSKTEGSITVQVRQDSPNPIKIRFLNNVSAGTSVCLRNAYCDVQGDRLVDQFVQSQMEQMTQNYDVLWHYGNSSLEREDFIKAVNYLEDASFLGMELVYCLSCVADPGFSEVASSVEDNKFELKITPSSLGRITDKLSEGFRWLGIECTDLPQMAANYLSRYNSIAPIDSFDSLSPKTQSADVQFTITLSDDGIDADEYLKSIEDSSFFHRHEEYESTLSTNEIVAIVLGCVIVVVVIILGIFCFVAPSRTKEDESDKLLETEA